MLQPAGHNIAELNIGRLLAPVGDPRVAGFIDAIDRVNGLGKRMDGFVWMMEGSGEVNAGNTEACVDGDPQMITNLTVWRDVAALEAFVWNTVHRQFWERRQDWFEILGAQHFVMWWVPQGHQPTLDEALERLEMRRTQGDSAQAFGWASLPQATLWRAHQAGGAA